MTEQKKVRISLGLILRQQFGTHALQWDHTKQIEQLNDVTHLRLDRQNIGSIDALELMGPKLTNLYLQCNLIEEIENLEFLSNLRFLMLAHNFITQVSGLKLLNKLGFLDISFNQIKYLDAEELPKSLVILNMEGNLCTHLPEYKPDIVAALPKLRTLDGQEVNQEENEEESDDESDEGEGYEYVDSDEIEEFDRQLTVSDAQNHSDTKLQQSALRDDSASDLSPVKMHRNLEDMLTASQNRLEEQFAEHKNNLRLLKEYRENTGDCGDPRESLRELLNSRAKSRELAQK